MIASPKTWKPLLRPAPAIDADRLWERIQVRRGRLRRLRAWSVLAPALVAAALVIAALATRPQPMAAILTRSDGASLAIMEAASATQIAFSDGSSIALAQGARLETRALTGQLFATELRAGKVVFDVMPHGPREWRVKAGTTEVRVLGTRFSVEHMPAGVAVSVARGVVQVSGPDVAHGSQTLRAGEALLAAAHVAGESPQLTAANAPQPSAAEAHASTPAGAADRAGRVLPQPSAAEAHASTPADAADRAGRVLPPQPSAAAGNAANRARRVQPPKPSHRGAAVKVAEPDARATSAAADVASALREADRARESGQFEHAAELLARLIAQHPEDSRAALAAITLGELYAGVLASPLRAAEAFERAGRLGLPAALAEEGAARLFEAYGAADRADAAARAARAYLRQFPDGPRRQAAQRWVSDR